MDKIYVGMLDDPTRFTTNGLSIPENSLHRLGATIISSNIPPRRLLSYSSRNSMSSKLRSVVDRIAFTPDHELPTKLSLLHRSLLLPLLSFASSIYNVSIHTRKLFYQLGIFKTKRLPVPVISVGNLTWGGNGKTPMVEFLSFFFSDMGISPLVLTRGYAGGDEVKMLRRHLSPTTARIGIGTNRAEVAVSFLKKHGCFDLRKMLSFENVFAVDKIRNVSEKIGIAILDDGMQHWSLWRDFEIVMINGMMPWGNNHLIPRGPLREPLIALERADVAVIHHADLVSDEQIKEIESQIWKVKGCIPIFLSRLAPMHFFFLKNFSSKLPLDTVQNMVVLCVSAIGFPRGFVQVIEKIGPSCVDKLNFGDHHFFQVNDIEIIKNRLRKLKLEFGTGAVVVVTEKDYDRDPAILSQLDGFTEVLVLCSSLQIMPLRGMKTDERFKDLVKEKLRAHTVTYT